jgi:UDP-N-acetylmuramoyl-tripeptide--D-alanyl-D-alanine ligase
MTIEKIYQLFTDSEGVSTDSRTINKNSIFFALKGENFNGNKFAVKAIEEGATYSIIDEKEFNNHPNCILVEDVLLTLQALANHHRKQFNIPVLGITGSNGKTTNKELIGAVLSKKYNLLMTQGNLNNHIGVPLTLLQLNDKHRFAIIEMGASKPRDIKELSEIAEPTHGLITNIGAAHLEGFGSLLGVINTKKELYENISKSNGVLFYNKDDETLKNVLPSNTENNSYGTKEGTITGELKGLTPYVQFRWNFKSTYSSPIITTNLVGKYNFTNFLAAACIGKYFKVDNDKICKALENYKPTNNRSQITEIGSNTYIVDCYNANPTSMLAALESFVEVTHPNKVAIIGDMLELGHYSEDEHQKIMDYLSDKKIKTLLVGSEFKKTKNNSITFNTVDELTSSKESKIENSLILLKGSRGIKLEKLLQAAAELKN